MPVIVSVGEADSTFNSRLPEQPEYYVEYDGGLECLGGESSAAPVREGVENKDPIIMTDVDAERALIEQMAAESIQNAFQRYESCKAAIRMRRVRSLENLSLSLAADTITAGLKRCTGLFFSVCDIVTIVLNFAERT